MKTKDFALKVSELSEDGTFVGYASVHGNVDSYGDRVIKGAFEKSLAKHSSDGTSVLMLWQHNPNEPVGVWDDLAEDSKGLRAKGRLILDVQKAREIHSLMKHNAIGGLSIGYQEVKAKDVDGVRDLEELDLYEISPVSFPANRVARIESVKSERIEEFARRLRDGDPMPIKEFEAILRDAGVPRSMAVQIASVGYAKAFQRDSGSDTASEAAEFLKLLGV